MVYRVTLTARAEADFQRLLTENADRYTPRERLDYVQALRAKCQGLDWFPKRSTPVTIKGRQYWRLMAARYWWSGSPPPNKASTPSAPSASC